MQRNVVHHNESTRLHNEEWEQSEEHLSYLTEQVPHSSGQMLPVSEILKTLDTIAQSYFFTKSRES